jgi:hypothetical protein
MEDDASKLEEKQQERYFQLQLCLRKNIMETV